MPRRGEPRSPIRDSESSRRTMRHQYLYLDPELIRQLLAGLDLLRLFNQLVLATGGDVDEAMDWMRYLQQEGHIPEEVDLEAFFASLEDQQLVQRDGEGGLQLTSGGERKVRKSAFEEIFSGLDRSGPGYHPIHAEPYHTNPREGLQLARGLLARQKQPNKQIFLITDGKPSAITEGGRIYKNPFGLDMRIVNLTLEEADVCRRQKVVITTFMLATDPMLTQFVEKLTQINRGRAYFASAYNLGEFILADYVRNRRRRIR